MPYFFFLILENLVHVVTVEAAFRAPQRFFEAAQLIDKRYAAAWRETIDPAHATVSTELRRPTVFNELERYAATHPQTIGAVQEPRNTTPYSVVDPAGDFASRIVTRSSRCGLVRRGRAPVTSWCVVP